MLVWAWHTFWALMKFLSITLYIVSIVQAINRTIEFVGVR